VSSDTTLYKEIAQRFNHIGGLQRPGHTDGNRFACELIYTAKDPERPSVMVAVGDKVVGPRTVGAFWLKPDTRPAI